MRVSVVALLSAFLLPLPVLADSITYSYTGNDFNTAASPYTTSDSVTGQFTLSAPLADNLSALTAISPTSFSFSVGPQTLTEANTVAAVDSFLIETDASGDITEWSIVLGGGPAAGVIDTEDEPGDMQDIAISPTGAPAFAERSPGTWTTSVAATPEPASISLVATGVLGMVGFTRRKFIAA